MKATARRRLTSLAALLSLAALSACSTQKLPERFHTLLPAERSTPATTAAPIYLDVLPVKVPEQVDHTQWVVRQPDDSLLMLEQDRWAAPLPDEIRGAIVERLTAQWGAIDVRSVAAPPGATWRVRVDVQRFESIPAKEVRIEATWSVGGSPAGGATLVCRSAFQESVDAPGIASLAAAHRHAVVRLADEMGRRLVSLSAGRPAGCT